MAREYARVKLTIWTDPDFRNLSEAAQRLYFLLLTSGDMNLCGVTDWREARLRALATDSTVDGLRHAAWELGQADLIAVDDVTEEALVRSFVRHDGVLKSPNMTKAFVKDFAGIASQKLMALVARETRRAFSENPDWLGAEAATPVTKQFPEADGNPFEMVPEWFRNGSETVPSETPKKTGNPSEKVPPSLNPHPSTLLQGEDLLSDAGAPDPRPTPYPPAFVEFWTVYPRKDKKREALAAWRRATRRATPEQILDGAKRYRDDPNRDDAYTKLPTTWIDGDCWESDAQPARNTHRPYGRAAAPMDRWQQAAATLAARDSQFPEIENPA